MINGLHFLNGEEGRLKLDKDYKGPCFKGALFLRRQVQGVIKIVMCNGVGI